MFGVYRLGEEGREVDVFIRPVGGSSVIVRREIAHLVLAESAIGVPREALGAAQGDVGDTGLVDVAPTGEAAELEVKRELVFTRIRKASDAYLTNVLPTNALAKFLILHTQVYMLVYQGPIGSNVNVASIPGLMGLPGNPVCVAKKHAASGLTRNAAIDNLSQLRECCAQLLRGDRADYANDTVAFKATGPMRGCAPHCLRVWCRQADIDPGQRGGLTSADNDRIHELEPEVRKLRQAKEDTDMAADSTSRDAIRADSVLSLTEAGEMLIAGAARVHPRHFDASYGARKSPKPQRKTVLKTGTMPASI